MPRLTDRRVAHAALPDSGQTFLWCSHDRGFGVRLNASGIRTFIVQSRADGRQRRISIGRVGAFTVDQARLRAREILHAMRLGIDPVQQAQAEASAGITLREALADYCQNKRTRNGPLTARTQSDINAHGLRDFADWLDRPVRAITRDGCATRFAEISKRGPTTANQAFRYLRAVLNFTSNRHWVGDEPLLAHNPVDVLRYSWHPVCPRSERIPFDRIGAVWRLLTNQAHEGVAARGERTAAALVQMLILTGGRLGEISKLTWDRVDLDARVPSWTIRPKDSKTRSGRILPLSRQAVAILRALPRHPDSPYVFVSRDGQSHAVNPGHTWRAVSALAGVHVSAHSMRRTFTNICLKLGIEMWKTEMLTSHVPTSTILVHYTDTADLRDSCANDVQMVGDWIEAQAMGTGTGTGEKATKDDPRPSDQTSATAISPA